MKLQFHMTLAVLSREPTRQAHCSSLPKYILFVGQVLLSRLINELQFWHKSALLFKSLN